MKKIIFTIIPLLIMLFHSESTFGQVSIDTTAIYRIETKDGNDYIGKIMSDTDAMSFS